MTVVEGGEHAVPRPGVLGWLKRQVPTREGMARNRWLRPVAHRILVPSLWRFNHRSVPRGVALGIMTAILFPFAHMPLAAALALPARANVPVAVSTTFINNPITIGPILFAAYVVGHWVLHLGAAVPGGAVAPEVHGDVGLLHRIAVGGPAIIVGLFIISVALAAAGYLLTSWAWRFRIARKWRNRRVRKP